MSTELAIVIKASALVGAASAAIKGLGGSMSGLGQASAVANRRMQRDYDVLGRRAAATGARIGQIDAFTAQVRATSELGEAFTAASTRAQGLGRSLSRARAFAEQSTAALTAYRTELNAQTGRATDAQRLRLRLLGEQATSARGDVRGLTSEFERARTQARRMDSELLGSRLSLQNLRGELVANGISTTGLSAQRARLSEGLVLERRRVDALGQSLAALNRRQAELQGLHGQREELSAEAADLRGEALGAAGAVGVVALPIKAAMAFESKMADVKKVVSFDTPMQFKQMGDDVMALTRTIPLAGTELAAIVAQGGQAGIARENLVGFAADAAKMGIAFDMSADEAGTAMAGLSNVFGVPIAKMGLFGDAINHLADNANSNGRDIVNVLTRVGSATKQLGLSEVQTAALSSTFLSMNKPPELAAQAIQGMTQTLSLAKVGKFDGELKKLGLTTKGFAAAMDKDAQGALTDFLGRVKQLPSKQQYPFLIDMFGANYADDVLLLTNRIDEYNKQLGAVNETNAQGEPLFKGSMTREFNNQSATTVNQLQLFKNGLIEVAKTVGDQMLPALNDLLKTTVIPMAHAFADWMAVNPNVTKSVVLIAAALAGLKVGSFAARAALLGLRMATLGGRIHILSFTTALMRGQGAAQAMRSGLGLSSRALIRQQGALGSAARGLAHVSRFARTAASSLQLLGFNPLTLLIAAVAVGAVLIYKYWQPITAFFGGLWDGIQAGMAPVMPMFAALGAVFGGLWAQVSTLLQPVISWLGEFFSVTQVAEGGARGFGEAVGLYIGGAMASVVTFVSDRVAQMQAAFSGGLTGILGLIANWSPLGAFYSAFASVMGWFGVTLPATFTGFGSMIISGLVNGITSGASRVVSAIKNMAVSAIDTAKSAFGINSPSRVFKKIGGGLTHGLDLGVIKGATRPLATIGTFADNLQQRFKNRAGQLKSTLSTRMQSNSAELAQARAQQSSVSSGTNSGSYVIHYSPQISAPNGHVDQIAGALRLSQREFEAMFERMVAGQARRSY